MATEGKNQWLQSDGDLMEDFFPLGGKKHQHSLSCLSIQLNALYFKILHISDVFLTFSDLCP